MTPHRTRDALAPTRCRLAPERRERPAETPRAAERALRRVANAAAFGLAVALLASLSSGCGYGVMHSARPTPAGSTDITAGVGVVANDNIDVFNGMLPMVQLEVRHGLSERVDIGARPFDGVGLAADVRVNLMDPDSPFALSTTTGLGGGMAWGTGGSTALANVGLFAEYHGADHAIPYAGAMLTNYWFFDREQPDSDMPGDVVEQSYTGDGVLAVTGGVALWERHFLVEYSYWTTVYNDPGDFFALIDNHVVSLVYKVRL